MTKTNIITADSNNINNTNTIKCNIYTLIVFIFISMNQDNSG